MCSGFTQVRFQATGDGHIQLILKPESQDISLFALLEYGVHAILAISYSQAYMR